MSLLDGLSDEQRSLRDAVRDVLARRSDSAAVRKAVDLPRGFDEALWQLLCDQIGVAALAIPERYGGAGASPAESHLVLEELGRTLTPSPLLGSGVLAAQVLLELGDAEACARLLPGIAAGTSIAAVCWAGADGRRDADPPVAADDRLLLTGTAHYVLDGDVADVLLVVAGTADGPVVAQVGPEAPGVHRTHSPTMDPTRRLATVHFEAAQGQRIEGDAGAAVTRALDTACVALTAEQVGAAERILERTVEYSTVRVQFGRPIGSFQALKHRMADLHVLVEAARSASYAAAAGLTDPAVAKAYCSEAFFTVAAEAIQLHGGIAITWEHDAHLYFKRAQGSAALFGPPAAYVRRLEAAAGLA